MDEGRQRLARLVREAREDLRQTQHELAAAAGLSDKTWYLIENPPDPAPALRSTTEALIEGVLGWRRGSVKRILAGGDPMPDPRMLINTYRTPRGVVRSLGRESRLSDDQITKVIELAETIMGGAVQEFVRAAEQVLDPEQ